LGEDSRLQTIADRARSEELLRWAASLPVEPVYQHTLLRPTKWLKYREAHSGYPVRLRILPAPPDAGVIFSDEDGHVKARAKFRNVATKALCVCVEESGLHINNIEHILATLYAFNVDNAIVEVEKKSLVPFLLRKRSLPIFPRSTLEYLMALKDAGIEEQVGYVRKYRSIQRIHTFTHKKRGDRITIEPQERGITIDYLSGYPKLDIPDARLVLNLTPVNFMREVSEARTLVNQYYHCPYLLAKLLGSLTFISYGIGVGVGPENAIVRLRGKDFSEPRYGGYEFELVRHKIVDFLAAVSLLGPLRGVKFTVVKSGHKFDLMVCRHLHEILRYDHRARLVRSR